MNSSRIVKYFILIEDINTSKFNTTSQYLNSRDIVCLRGGELFTSNIILNNSKINVKLVDSKNQVAEYSIEPSKLRIIDENSFNVLIPCPVEKRLKIFYSTLKKIVKLKLGDIVYVERNKEKLVGKVRYRGKINRTVGEWFGIELSLDWYRYGNTNGEPYFTCSKDFGLIISAEEIRFGEREPEFTEALSIGRRVMWPSDSGNEYGTVRWFGKLKGEPSKAWMVGVEFDKPVGFGTGSYQSEQLFHAKENHASFVPLIGLAPCNDDSPDLETFAKSEKIQFALNLDKDTADDIYNNPSQSSHEPTPKFEIGSRVRIKLKAKNVYGVIRWKGFVPSSENSAVGIEVEETFPGCSSGDLLGEKKFACPPQKAFFFKESAVYEDRRAIEDVSWCQKNPFGALDSPLIRDEIVKSVPLEEIEKTIVGKYRGIQGYNNSCYLDSTLFALLVMSDAFDHIIFEPTKDNVKSQLRAIISTARKYGWIRADYIYNLRIKLEELSDGKLPGFLKEEQDPEEFINFLFSSVLKIESLLEFNDNVKMKIFNITETDNVSDPPTISELLSIAFVKNDLNLDRSPKILLVQMPRSGLTKSVNYILPDLRIDIAPFLKNYEYHCAICGSAASFKCTDCLNCPLFRGNVYNRIFYCADCNLRLHTHSERKNHKSTALTNKTTDIHSPIHMNLKSIICISTSHYVSFVRCGKEVDDAWLFQDSMADRVSFSEDKFGFNIPCVKLYKNIGRWLNKPGSEIEESIRESQLPRHVLRLLSDAYICMYELDSI